MKLHRWPLVALPLCLLSLAACGPADPPADSETAEPAEPASQPDDANLPRIDDHDEHEPSATPAREGGRLEAHEHGHATLAVTVDGDQLSIGFRAPLISLGATENPQTETDQAAVDALGDTFASSDEIITVNAPARCSPISTTSGTHIAGGHGALEADYVFSCQNIDKLKTVRFKSFETYPGLASIDAVFVSGTGQSVQTLTASNPVFDVN